jgi:hypothetical protein
MRAVALLLIAAGLVLAQDRKPAKFEYKSPSLGFQVGLPGPPTKTTSAQQDTAAGRLPVNTVRYDADRELVLSVTVTDFPAEFVKVPAAKIFDGVLDGLKAADGKETAEEVKGAPDGVAVKQWRIVAGKSVLRVRAYLVGTRLYQVMANGSAKEVDGAFAADLFDTFKLAR